MFINLCRILLVEEWELISIDVLKEKEYAVSLGCMFELK